MNHARAAVTSESEYSGDRTEAPRTRCCACALASSEGFFRRVGDELEKNLDPNVLPAARVLPREAERARCDAVHCQRELDVFEFAESTGLRRGRRDVVPHEWGDRAPLGGNDLDARKSGGGAQV